MKVSIFISMVFFAQLGFTQSIEKYSIDSGGSSASVGNIQVLYTIGEAFVSDNTVNNVIISEGFINPMVIKLNAKMFLEGAYDSNVGVMRDDLRNIAIIPTTSPYADALVANSSVFNLGGTSGTGLSDDDIVDWVWVELRDANDNTTVVSSRSALIQRDGDVVEVDGINFLTINVGVGNYFLSLSHKNHLGVITITTKGFASGVTSIDITMDSNLIQGGANGIANLGDGNFGLYSGDFNGDGQVQNTDKTAVEQQRGLSGYNNADIDMNGEVQNTDLNNLLIPNLGKGEQFTRMMMMLHAKRKTKTTKLNKD